MKRTRIVGQSGFTLVEIMVALGITTLVSLGVASLITSVMQQKSILERKVEVADVLTGVGNYVLSKEGCQNLFAGSVWPFGLTQKHITSIPGYKGPGAVNGVPFGVGSFMAVGSDIKSLTLETDPFETPSGASIKVGSQQFFKRFILLKMSYKKVDQNLNSPGSNPVIANRNYKIPILTDAANTFQTCTESTPMTPDQLCQSVGGTVTIPGCKLGSQCQNFGSYIRKSCDPAYLSNCIKLHAASPDPYINGTTGAASCPPGAASVLTGIFQGPSHIESCGKKCTFQAYTIEHFITCVRCD